MSVSIAGLNNIISYCHFADATTHGWFRLPSPFFLAGKWTSPFFVQPKRKMIAAN
jgi:hypothetical protein